MTTVIGIDWSAVPRDVGLARASCEDGSNSLLEVCAGGREAVGKVTGWIQVASGPVLLAIDAPLGWPRPLAVALPSHRAGQPLIGEANELFRRHTDRKVHEILKKQPLDVGADHIARTAHSALVFLQNLRRMTRKDINLAWRWDALQGISAIEVYPAGTLVAYGARATGYKGRDDREARQEVLDGLPQLGGTERYRHDLLDNANVLDAAVCVIAGIDFLAGRAPPPQNHELAAQEGWIWVPSPFGRDAPPRR